MNLNFGPSGQPITFHFSAALGLAQQAHYAAVTAEGADLFSHLQLDRASVARELPSLACAPCSAAGLLRGPYVESVAGFLAAKRHTSKRVAAAGVCGEQGGQTYSSAADGTSRIRLLDSDDFMVQEPDACGNSDAINVIRIEANNQSLWRFNTTTKELHQFSFGLK